MFSQIKIALYNMVSLFLSAYEFCKEIFSGCPKSELDVDEGNVSIVIANNNIRIVKTPTECPDLSDDHDAVKLNPVVNVSYDIAVVTSPIEDITAEKPYSPRLSAKARRTLKNEKKKALRETKLLKPIKKSDSANANGNISETNLDQDCCVYYDAVDRDTVNIVHNDVTVITNPSEDTTDITANELTSNSLEAQKSNKKSRRKRRSGKMKALQEANLLAENSAETVLSEEADSAKSNTSDEPLNETKPKGDSFTIKRSKKSRRQLEYDKKKALRKIDLMASIETLLSKSPTSGRNMDLGCTAIHDALDWNPAIIVHDDMTVFTSLTEDISEINQVETTLLDEIEKTDSNNSNENVSGTELKPDSSANQDGVGLNTIFTVPNDETPIKNRIKDICETKLDLDISTSQDDVDLNTVVIVPNDETVVTHLPGDIFGVNQDETGFHRKTGDYQPY